MLRIFRSKALRTGLLAMTIAIVPAATTGVAQSGGGGTGSGTTSSGSGTTSGSTRSDNSTDWGWLGLLGLAGLLGLLPKKRTAADDNYAGARTAATR